jgi:hypothetical protein
MFRALSPSTSPSANGRRYANGRDPREDRVGLDPSCGQRFAGGGRSGGARLPPELVRTARHGVAERHGIDRGQTPRRRS